MNLEEFLLAKLSEEASELAQIAAKGAQFGINSYSPCYGNDTLSLLIKEANDVLGIIRMLKTLLIIRGEDSSKLDEINTLVPLLKKEAKTFSYLQKIVESGKLVLTEKELDWFAEVLAAAKYLLDNKVKDEIKSHF